MVAASVVDLLVFGPHPDDIEIGFGGTVALHAALGFRVGLCDLTRGELGSNGTPAEREAEAEAARAVLGAAYRASVSAAHRKPRHALWCVERCGIRRGSHRPRAGAAPEPLQGFVRSHAPVNVGIVCYASVGGSGIVATELAKSLAARGHDV